MATSTKIVTIPLENTPGKLAEATRALADENVNILAIETTSVGEFGLARFVTEKPDVAQRTLESKGFPVTVGEFLEAELPNRPGELAKLCESLAKSNVNIEGLWAGPATGTSGRILLRVDDANAARRVVQSFAPKTLTH
jgi:hypothetical protein